MEKVYSFTDEQGERYMVPHSEMDEFRKAVPNASSTFDFNDDKGRSYAVPQKELEEFSGKVPKAQRAYRFRSKSGEEYSVPITEMGDFYKTFLSDPDFEEDRKESIKKAEKAAASPKIGTVEAFADMYMEYGKGGWTGLKDSARGVSRAVTTRIPKLIWGSLAVLGGKDATMFGRFADTVSDQVDFAAEKRTWEHPELDGWAAIGPGAFESVVANLLPAIATRGRSVYVMPALYGLSQASEVYDKAMSSGHWSKEEAIVLAAGAGVLEGGVEYLSTLWGAGRQAKEIGKAIGGKQLALNARTVLWNLFKDVVGEVTQETVQEGVGYQYESLAEHGTFDYGQSLEAGLMGGAQGGMAALIQGGPGAIATSVDTARGTRPPTGRIYPKGTSPQELALWVIANPVKAAELSEIAQPSRKDFDKAGLPRVTAAERARVASDLAELARAANDEAKKMGKKAATSPTDVELPGPSVIMDDGKVFSPGDTIPAGTYQIDGETVMLADPVPAEVFIRRRLPVPPEADETEPAGSEPAPVTANDSSEDGRISGKRAAYQAEKASGAPDDVASRAVLNYQEKANDRSEPMNLWLAESGARGLVPASMKPPFKKGKVIATFYPEDGAGKPPTATPEATETEETTNDKAEPETPPEKLKEPSKSDVGTETEAMQKEAQRWQGAHMNAEKMLLDAGDRRGALKIAASSGKSNLDDYLMRKFGVDRATAHEVSNALTQFDMPADQTAKVEDFAGEEWADAAIKSQPPSSSPAAPAVKAADLASVSEADFDAMIDQAIEEVEGEKAETKPEPKAETKPPEKIKGKKVETDQERTTRQLAAIKNVQDEAQAQFNTGIITAEEKQQKINDTIYRIDLENRGITFERDSKTGSVTAIHEATDGSSLVNIGFYAVNKRGHDQSFTIPAKRGDVITQRMFNKALNEASAETTARIKAERGEGAKKKGSKTPPIAERRQGVRELVSELGDLIGAITADFEGLYDRQALLDIDAMAASIEKTGRAFNNYETLPASHVASMTSTLNNLISRANQIYADAERAPLPQQQDEKKSVITKLGKPEGDPGSRQGKNTATKLLHSLSEKIPGVTYNEVAAESIATDGKVLGAILNIDGKQPSEGASAADAQMTYNGKNVNYASVIPDYVPGKLPNVDAPHNVLAKQHSVQELASVLHSLDNADDSPVTLRVDNEGRLTLEVAKDEEPDMRRDGRAFVGTFNPVPLHGVLKLLHDTGNTEFTLSTEGTGSPSVLTGDTHKNAYAVLMPYKTRGKSTNTAQIKQNLEQSALKKRKGVKPKDEGQHQLNTPSEAIKSAAKHGVKGIESAIDGLHKLFGANERFNLGVSFDENTYAEAKPYFQKAYQEFSAAGHDLMTFVKWAVQNFGSNIRPYLQRFRQDLTNPKATTNPQVMLADTLEARIRSGEKITWQDLFKAADTAYEGTRADGKYQSTDAYEALELAINRVMARNADVDAATALENIRQMDETLDNVPTQTNRSTEKDLMQQFSTPPHYAYAANWVAGVKPGDVMLEPSGGTGSIATHSKATGAQVIGNELSPRRAELLKEFADVVHTEDAEQISNILTEKPTVVVMNPPFSQAGERMKGKKQLLTGAKHIEQALKLLQPGGRLVAIVGRGMEFGRPTYNAWWDKIGQSHNIRANVSVSGDVYSKYGTSFGTQLVVIDKVAPDGKAPVVGVAETVQDLVNLLTEIRNDRPTSMATAADAKVNSGTTTDGTAQGSGVSASVLAEVGTDGGRSVSGSADGVKGADGRVPGAEAGKPDGRGTGKTAIRRTSRHGSGDNAGRGAGDTGKPSAHENDRDGGRVSTDLPAAVNAELEKGKQAENVEDGGAFETYSPAVTVKGAQSHPSPLVESAAMASVQAPSVDYRPSIPASLIESGAISDAQLEPIIRGGAAHQQTVYLTSGESSEFQTFYPGETAPKTKRRGFFVGDGTGVGKGRIAAGFILDNWNQGRTRAIWVSKKADLMSDAIRDWTAMGMPKEDITLHNKTKDGDAIKGDKGIIFTTYDTLGTSERKRGKNKLTRVEQLAKWFGKDYDGVIILDESHNMGNAVAMRGKRGATKPSARALMGIELQRRLPNARVVYMSATGATEVSNLSYADRLGLWGDGTPFSSRDKFITQVSAGGIAAMELVARDMKAMGSYLSRTLSFKGVGYSRLTHTLSQEQRQMYNTLAGAWQNVLQNIEAALRITAGYESSDGNQQVDSKQRAQALSQFWSTHQRFFNQVLTAMQMPSVLKSIQADVDAGRGVVIQIVNTLEAATERAIAALDAGESLESVDITPRGQLIDMIEGSFPVVQMEQYVDANDNIRMRPVEDANGNPVLNREAVAMRDNLVESLLKIAVPESPLDQLIRHFGHGKVAEVTGRKRRIITNDQGLREIQQRGTRANESEINDFMDDKKQILVFSPAGDTGASYHASLARKNQRPRRHYVLQAGWEADRATQGLGRSHRSDQAHLPHFTLVETDLPGHKRFISTIARRLEQLGALSKGQRDAGSGLFSESDNLESSHAYDALQTLIQRIAAHDRDLDIDLGTFEQQTGFSLLTEQGSFNERPVEVRQFLNRLLSLDIDMQNKVFKAYSEQLESNIDFAKQQGTLDVGMEEVKAEKIELVNEAVVSSDPRTGAETKHVELAIWDKTKKIPFDRVAEKAAGFARNTRSGEVYVFRHTSARTDEDGNIREFYERWGPSGKSLVAKAETGGGRYEAISEEQARAAWEKKLESLPDTHKSSLHMITGTLLPVWDKLGGKPQVKRAVTADGQKFLGRVVPENKLTETLHALGVDRKIAPLPASEAKAAIMSGADVRLGNGWIISSANVSGERRIEIRNVGSPMQYDEITDAGGFTERHQYRMRAYLPTGDAFDAAYDRIVANHPIEDIIRYDSDDTQGYAGGHDDARPERKISGRRQDGAEVTAKPTQPTAVIDTIRKLWPGLSVRGRATWTRKKTPGWYSNALGEMRLKNAGDIIVAVHELGHHFDRQLGKWSGKTGLASGIPSELIALGRELYGDERPKGGYRAEGFAEFIGRYLTGDDIQSKAPKLYEWFTTEYLVDNPKEAAKLRQLEDVIAQFQLQTPEMAIKAFMSPRRLDWSGQRIAAAMAGIEEKWISSLMPVLHGMQETGANVMNVGDGPGQIRADQHPFMLGIYFARTAGGRTAATMLRNSVNLFGIPNGKSLAEVLAPIENRTQEEHFWQYLVAKRAVTRYHDHGLEVGISRADAEAIIAKYQSPQFDQVVEEFTDLAHRQLYLLVESGDITLDLYNQILELNPIFAPMMRQFLPSEKRQGGKNKGKGLHKVKGGTQPIVHPLVAFVTQVERLHQRAMQTHFLRSLVQFYDQHKGKVDYMGQFMSEVPAPKEAVSFTLDKIKKTVASKALELGADPDAVSAAMMETWDELTTIYRPSKTYKGTDNIVALEIDGKRRFFEVRPDLLPIIEGITQSKFLQGDIGAIFRLATNLQRLGATGLNPAFGLIRNLLRDAGTAAVLSDYHFHVPVLSTLQGMIMDVIGTDYANLYHSAGLDIAGFYGQQRQAKRLGKQAMAKTKIGQMAVAGPMDVIMDVLGCTEIGPRLMEFRGAYQSAKKQGMSDSSAMVFGGCASKDVTVNFSDAGSIGRQVNEVVLFANANIKSAEKLARALGMRQAMPWSRHRNVEGTVGGEIHARMKTAGRTTARALAWVTIGALMNYLRNRDKEWWKELPPYEKWNYVHLELPGGKIMRIPLPFEIGALFGAAPIALLEESRTPGSFKEAVAVAIENQMPFDFGVTEDDFRHGIAAVVRNISLVSPAADILINEDWKGSTIVPRYLENLPTDLQYKHDTSHPSKWIGKQLGIAPAEVEHILNGYTGNLYGRTQKAMMIAIGKGEIDVQDKSTLPIIGALFLKPNTARLTNDFYTRFDELEKLKKGDRINGEEDAELKAMRKVNARLNKLWRERRETLSEGGVEGKRAAQEVMADIHDIIRTHNDQWGDE